MKRFLLGVVFLLTTLCMSAQQASDNQTGMFNHGYSYGAYHIQIFNFTSNVSYYTILASNTVVTVGPVYPFSYGIYDVYTSMANCNKKVVVIPQSGGRLVAAKCGEGYQY